jgi:hypothetical protein
LALNRGKTVFHHGLYVEGADLKLLHAAPIMHPQIPAF